MELIFEQIRHSRRAFLQMIEGMDADKLNTIPEGFNNNIIWNLGHIYASTVSLCYKRTGVAPERVSALMGRFAKGTRPEAVTTEEIAFIREALLTSIDKLEKDYRDELFPQITPFATDTYKYTMNSIEEVITCTLAHDNYHYGYTTALIRAINR